MTFRIEHMLSAPLFLSPQLVGDRLFFISNLSGSLSLWAMDSAGSVPEPMLPPDVALLTPKLLGGQAFVALPDLGVIVVMIDRDGDELLQPCLVPIDGGDPQPLFGDRFAGQQVELVEVGPDGRGSLWVDPRKHPEQEAYHFEVTGASLVPLGCSRYGNVPRGHSADRSRYLLIDQYSPNDTTLWLWERDAGERRLLHGVPLDERRDGHPAPLTGFDHGWFVDDEQSILVETTWFDDLGGLGWLSLADPATLEPVTVTGAVHQGVAEWEHGARRLSGERFLVSYNVDGVSWGYEATLGSRQRMMHLDRVVWGQGELSDGVVVDHHHDRSSGRVAVAFSSATTPAQLATVSPAGVTTTVTRNRLLGIDPQLLSPGEDASYTSHDGLRISARLYLPSDRLGFEGPRPVVYYIHGGPQGQERPDFTWFSMPLIQYLTLHGFAVFVPNVRGSTGYGQAYMKHVDRDWGGQDRLDHVAGVQRLRDDPRVDPSRIGVMGRSYGGFMTLTLASRHPELWSAAVDMFGPYDLLSWATRLPESWRTYFRLVIGDPETERDELVSRSPRTYIGALACPLLVVQGANDPRVTRTDSDELVAELRAAGRDVDYLVFEDEGHDVTRLANKAHCYRTITAFFERHLAAHPGPPRDQRP
ncbi:MAG TPA: alpha/beta fold hydrolase [Micromonosporaceae bacterium]|nr:alpha/beta fold hydrolase [Micromonosporaceae bacterium]